jgi:oligoribonuclease NrnB/cAMP/cGMP phosphodiesterase (DHH superfamily)
MSNLTVVEPTDKDLPTTVIYHAKCADGFTAAWVVRKKYPDADFFPASYTKDPPDVKGRRCIIVDFSFKPEVLKKIIKDSKEFILLDHHKTAKEAGVDDLPGCHIDTQRSGCGLAWDHFFEGNRPRVVDFVEDRDLWRWKLDDAREVSAYISIQKQTFNIWDRVSGEIEYAYASVVNRGRAILDAENTHIDTLLQDAYFANFNGHDNVLIVNCGVDRFNSEIGSRAADHEDADFGLVWHHKSDGRVKVSFRSSEEKADVSIVASELGGGGHRNASAAYVEDLSTFLSMLTPMDPKSH